MKHTLDPADGAHPAPSPEAPPSPPADLTVLAALVGDDPHVTPRCSIRFA